MKRELIERALPHVPAGISAMAGDLTDHEDRVQAVDWLMQFYAYAETFDYEAITPDPGEHYAS